MTEMVRVDGSMLRQILDASYPLWNEGLSREAYGRWWDAQQLTAWGRDHLRRYALVSSTPGPSADPRLLASAKQYDFSATLDGRHVRVLGIGAVFTQPDARGHGYGRVLIERMLDAGAREGFDIALLFSEIGADYYHALGFSPVAFDESVIGVVEKPGAPATLIRAGDTRDLPAIAALGVEQARRFRFHLDRDVDLIQYALAKKRLLSGLGPAGARELQFFIAEEGASAVAYVVISVREGSWTIEECGDRDPSGARVGAMLQALLAREPTERRPTISAWLPPGWMPPQLRAIDRHPPTEVMMVRALSDVEVTTLEGRHALYWHADMF